MNLLENVGLLVSMMTGKETEVSEVKKNNGTVLHGVIIKNGELCPCIYIDDLVDGEITFDSVMEIANKVVEIWESIDMTDVNVDDFFDYEKIKGNLKLRLINKNKNKETLDELPYKEFLDLAIIVIAEKRLDTGVHSLKVDYNLLEKWNKSFDEVAEVASANTYKEANFKSIFEMMRHDDTVRHPVASEIPDDMMYILTNGNANFGASQICNLSLMAVIAEKLESDLIVIPSSIHEVLVAKADLDVDTVSDFVKEANADFVDEQDILSDHAYYFSRQTGWSY